MTENEFVWPTLTNLLTIHSWTPKDLGPKGLFLFGLNSSRNSFRFLKCHLT